MVLQVPATSIPGRLVESKASFSGLAMGPVLRRPETCHVGAMLPRSMAVSVAADDAQPSQSPAPAMASAPSTTAFPKPDDPDAQLRAAIAEGRTAIGCIGKWVVLDLKEGE
ncbi:hypothetical protein Aple_052360 [Acrocarpospora pleiomorpha]|uniref:Uncharacterized protein n=1 Tax=Acrocarpospora pleiomorpha TaxID=90975 RepID=A0A5M3XQL9_9ACTN|nr:hypothetical protein Aple_052360 [Acrocarpospora pleiomorpha]